MNVSEKQKYIQQKAVERAIKWSRHALSELAQESFTVIDVELALGLAEVIEDYPHHHRHLPDCLVLSWISSEQPVHCVVAINEMNNYILVVTVYQPSSEEWYDDWRRRR